MITKEILLQICEDNDVDLDDLQWSLAENIRYVLYTMLADISWQLTCNFMYWSDEAIYVQLCLDMKWHTMYHNLFEWEMFLTLDENVDQINEAIEQAQSTCNDLWIDFIINPVSLNE